MRATEFFALLVLASACSASLKLEGDAPDDDPGDHDADSHPDREETTGCHADDDCANALFCDGRETCSHGICAPPVAAPCDDRDSCTVDLCSEVARACSHMPVDADGDTFGATVGPDGESCPGTDCDDSDPEVHPGAVRSCRSERDFDCNGTPDVDDPLSVLLAPTVLTESPSQWVMPEPLWDATHFILSNTTLWLDPSGEPTLKVTPIGLDGEPLGPDTLMRLGPVFSSVLVPVVMFVGSDLWAITSNRPSDSEPNGFMIVRLPDGGPPPSPPIFVPTTWMAFHAFDSAWGGDRAALVWSDLRDVSEQVYILVLDGAGVPLGPEVRISSPDSGWNQDPSVVWDGDRFVAVWFNDTDHTHRFATVDPETLVASRDLQFGPPDPAWLAHIGAPPLLWTGSVHATVWLASSAPVIADAVQFATISRDGTLVSGPERLDDGTDRYMTPPALAWTGSEFVVAWTSGSPRPSEPYRVNVVRLGADGSPTGSPLLLEGFVGSPEWISIAWTGSSIGLFWSTSSTTRCCETHYTSVGCR